MGFVLHRLPLKTLEDLDSVLGDEFQVTRVEEERQFVAERKLLRFRVAIGRGAISVTQWPTDEFPDHDDAAAIVYIAYDHPNPLRWRADYRVSRRFMDAMRPLGLHVIPDEELAEEGMGDDGIPDSDTDTGSATRPNKSE